MMRSASGYGNGRSSTPLMTLKIAVLAPMPRPSVRMKASEKPGIRGRVRRARRMSSIMCAGYRRDDRDTASVSRSETEVRAGGVPPPYNSVGMRRHLQDVDHWGRREFLQVLA